MSSLRSSVSRLGDNTLHRCTQFAATLCRLDGDLAAAEVRCRRRDALRHTACARVAAQLQVGEIALAREQRCGCCRGEGRATRCCPDAVTPKTSAAARAALCGNARWLSPPDHHPVRKRHRRPGGPRSCWWRGRSERPDPCVGQWPAALRHAGRAADAERSVASWRCFASIHSIVLLISLVKMFLTTSKVPLMVCS